MWLKRFSRPVFVMDALSLIARLPLCLHLRSMIRARYLDLVYAERASRAVRVLQFASLLCDSFENPIVLPNDYVHSIYRFPYPVDGWSRRVLRVLRVLPVHERTPAANRKLSRHVSRTYREEFYRLADDSRPPCRESVDGHVGGCRK